MLALLLASILAAPILASPTPFQQQNTNDITFTPGPGLPSLESLNLTAAELIHSATQTNELEKRFSAAAFSSQSLQSRQGSHDLVPKCIGANYGEVTGIQACALYLSNPPVGSLPCDAPTSGNIIELCSLERKRVRSVITTRFRPFFESDGKISCFDAALAVFAILKDCTGGCDGDLCFARGEAFAGGAAVTVYAWGNGNRLM